MMGERTVMQEALFYKFSLERHVPADHLLSSIDRFVDLSRLRSSKNRHGRFRDSNLLRELFEATVRRCIEEGLVSGAGFAVDASLIRADAGRPWPRPGG